MSKRSFHGDADISDRSMRSKMEVECSWLQDILFGDDLWGGVPKHSSDQVTLQTLCVGAGMRVSLVANPRHGVCIYTHSDALHSVIGE
jgi:hypothetical protein